MTNVLQNILSVDKRLCVARIHAHFEGDIFWILLQDNIRSSNIAQDMAHVSGKQN